MENKTTLSLSGLELRADGNVYGYTRSISEVGCMLDGVDYNKEMTRLRAEAVRIEKYVYDNFMTVNVKDLFEKSKFGHAMEIGRVYEIIGYELMDIQEQCGPIICKKGDGIMCGKHGCQNKTATIRPVEREQENENVQKKNESVHGWIRVEDRLPEYHEEVLCVNTHTKDGSQRVLTGHLFRLMQGERSDFIDANVLGDKHHYLYGGGDYWAFPYICHPKFITHWMPLPAAPPTQKEK